LDQLLKVSRKFDPAEAGKTTEHSGEGLGKVVDDAVKQDFLLLDVAQEGVVLQAQLACRLQEMAGFLEMALRTQNDEYLPSLK
jgi:hypothetical protein